MAAPLSSTDSLAPPPPLRRRPRRLVFDRRYGWIFDEWTDPADQALSGGRGMFCAVTMARSLVNAAASSLEARDASFGVRPPNHVADTTIYTVKQGVPSDYFFAGNKQINYAASSISNVLEHPKRLPLPAYVSSLAFQKKEQAWFRELECSGVVADLKLIHCCTHSVLECTATDCLCLTKKHDHL